MWFEQSLAQIEKVFGSDRPEVVSVDGNPYAFLLVSENSCAVEAHVSYERRAALAMPAIYCFASAVHVLTEEGTHALWRSRVFLRHVDICRRAWVALGARQCGSDGSSAGRLISLATNRLR